MRQQSVLQCAARLSCLLEFEETAASYNTRPFFIPQNSLYYFVAKIIVATRVPNPVSTVNIDNTNWITL